MINDCINYLVKLFKDFVDNLSSMELTEGVTLLGLLLAGIVIVFLISYTFNGRK